MTTKKKEVDSILFSGTEYTHVARKRLQQLLDCGERQQQIDIRDRAAGYLNESGALRSGTLKKAVNFQAAAWDPRPKGPAKKSSTLKPIPPQATPVLKPAYFRSSNNYVSQLRNFSLQSSFDVNYSPRREYVFVAPQTTVIPLSKSEEYAQFMAKVRQLESLWQPAVDIQHVPLPDEEFVQQLAHRLVPADKYAELLTWRSRGYRLAKQLHPVSVSKLAYDVLSNLDQVLVYQLYDAAETVLADGTEQSQERVVHLAQRGQALLKAADLSHSSRRSASARVDDPESRATSSKVGSRNTSAHYRRKLNEEMAQYAELETEIEQQLRVKAELKATVSGLQAQVQQLESEKDALEVDNKKLLKDITIVLKSIELQRPKDPAELVNRLLSSVATQLDEISRIEAEMLRSSAYLPLVDYENLVDTSVSAEAQVQKLEYLKSTLSEKTKRYEDDIQRFLQTNAHEVSESDVCAIQRFIEELPEESHDPLEDATESKWRWYIS